MNAQTVSVTQITYTHINVSSQLKKLRIKRDFGLLDNNNVKEAIKLKSAVKKYIACNSRTQYQIKSRLLV